MSASWGIPSRPGTLERAEGMLQERAREKLLAHAATIRAELMEAADSQGQMRADDVAACLTTLGLDATQAPIATIVDAHTTARGLVSCRPLLDEILGTLQSAVRPARSEIAQVDPAPQPQTRQYSNHQSYGSYKYTGRKERTGFSASPLHRLRQKWRAAAYQNGRMDIRRLFRYYDRDNSGGLDFEEFRVAARKDAKLTKQELSDAGLRKLFERVDTDEDGTIGIDEFRQLLEGDELPHDEARSIAPKSGLAQVESFQHGPGSSGGGNTFNKQRQSSLGPRVLVRVQNFPTERALKGLQKFDPDDTGKVPVEAFASVCRTVGLTTDQISVLLKEYPRSHLSSGPTVQYHEFIKHLTTPLGEAQAQEQLQTMLKLAQQPANFCAPPSSAHLSEQSDRETDFPPSVVSTAGATVAESESSRRLLELIHGLSEDERTLSLELWKRCEELEQEVKASRRQLSEGGHEMVADSQHLMRQLRDYQQQCKRETGESLTMVVESRRMLSIVTKEKEQASQERDALATELADLKLQLAKATDGASLTVAKANQAEHSTAQLRGELANARTEASYMKTRVRELDDELAAASFHLASVQDENAALLEECERLRAANKAGRLDTGRPVATERTLELAARRAWEDHAFDDHAVDGPPPPADLDMDDPASRRRRHGRTDDRRRQRHSHGPSHQ